MANEFAASIDGIYHGFIRFRKHNYFTGDHLVSFGSLLRTTRRVVLRNSTLPLVPQIQEIDLK